MTLLPESDMFMRWGKLGIVLLPRTRSEYASLVRNELRVVELRLPSRLSKCTWSVPSSNKANRRLASSASPLMIGVRVTRPPVAGIVSTSARSPLPVPGVGAVKT